MPERKPWQVVVEEDAGKEEGDVSTVRVHVQGREKLLCRRALGVLTLDNPVRKMALVLVEWRCFEYFILGCILINSILLGIYQHRATEDEDHYALNEFIDGWADNILWVIFTLESILKFIAWGAVCTSTAFLRDPWNVLDFIVVLSGLVERLGLLSSVSFLRLLRLLRALRSLNAVPQLKLLVNTTLKSVVKMSNVVVMGLFLWMLFGIIGISLFNGILYRECHEFRNPVLAVPDVDGFVEVQGNPNAVIGGCWYWPKTGEGRVCGGNYMCEAGGVCGGHEEDSDESLRPNFPGGKRGYPWCEGSKPQKPNAETDFVHFDNIGGAILLVFQCMTLEGWTDLMYYVEDAYYLPWAATVYFVLMICFTYFFMINFALAVVDEVQDEFAADKGTEEDAQPEAEDEDGGEMVSTTSKISNASNSIALMKLKKEDAEEDNSDFGSELSQLWWKNSAVGYCKRIADSDYFANFIMLVIAINVVNMCMAWFNLYHAFGTYQKDLVIEYLELVLLGIFIIEMFIMIFALGPIGYVKNPITCFDGVVVLFSITELIVNRTSEDGGGGAWSALRTVRLFRVMNKLASKWKELRVLLKAMVYTGRSLNYWLLLFFIVLYFFTLLCMSIFTTSFHFEDTDDLAELKPQEYAEERWCPETSHLVRNRRQDCIPRAHFDTFPWGFVTVFQIMTGENWNTIMYACMRVSERWQGTVVPPQFIVAMLFCVLILFGQIMFLSLFLSMLIAKFQEAQEIESRRQTLLMEKKRMNSKKKLNSKSSHNLGSDDSVGQAKSGNALAKVQPEPPEGETDGEILPGAIPDESGSGQGDKTFEPVVPQHHKSDPAVRDADGGGDVAVLESKPAAGAWPYGYAWFIFHESNPVRRSAVWILTTPVKIGSVTVLTFDSFILVCILCSTLCMMTDTPLSPPDATLTRVVRTADVVFACIFIVEMSIKLVAMGLIWGQDAYLRTGWNVLDGLVVAVSIVSLATGGEGPGFLRTLRILRTFRPLRVISRNEGLKVVVQTVFSSCVDLLGLVIVFSLFLLIFALVFLMNLKGALYECVEGDAPVGYLGPAWGQLPETGPGFTTPMCLFSGSEVTNAAELETLPMGVFDPATGLFNESACPLSLQRDWRRASADTPICLARCDPTLENHPGLEHLCSRKYASVHELPSDCAAADGGIIPNDSPVGRSFINDMMRTLVLPCGGWDQTSTSAELVSCQKNFCPHVGAVSESCKNDCKYHKYFCTDVCKDDVNSHLCDVCRHECEAACMCEDFCTPLIKDAALCHEQGGAWRPQLAQNFNNIANAMLTLFEISTTEGWVDVMYAASDTVGLYRQPLRDATLDNGFPLYLILFPIWIFTSFMFLINLAVGVMLNQFDAHNKENDSQLLTETQKKWVNSRKMLFGRRFFFDLTNLHLIPEFQRRVYSIISHKYFDRLIMTCIVVNTIVMALTWFPAPKEQWKDHLQKCNFVFAGIFTLEAILKLVALRWNYWLDNWNRFDFTCVAATLIGIVLKQPPMELDMAVATSVIRILRVARLFRLLRFLRGLNRLFMCLLISIPKLMNVGTILILIWCLFGILGMSLFGTAKFVDDGTLNSHANFQTIFRAIVTLFRASTGEAWNSVMHDLGLSEADFFRDQQWCTPQNLFQTRDLDSFEVLKSKCLMPETGSPNACPYDPGNFVPFSQIYWVAYTIAVYIMLLNLVVAVILQGYEEGKDTEEADNLEICLDVWKKYDPDRILEIDLPDALEYINECLRLIKEEKTKNGHKAVIEEFPKLEGKTLVEVSRNVPMKYARAIQMPVRDDNKVTLISASRQVLRLALLEKINGDMIKELDQVGDVMTEKEKAKLEKLESSKSGAVAGSDFATNAAAMRIQRVVRRKIARIKRKQALAAIALKKKMEDNSSGNRCADPAGDSVQDADTKNAGGSADACQGASGEGFQGPVSGQDEEESSPGQPVRAG